jgi:hypothetical protein
MKKGLKRSEKSIRAWAENMRAIKNLFRTSVRDAERYAQTQCFFLILHDHPFLTYVHGGCRPVAVGEFIFLLSRLLSTLEQAKYPELDGEIISVAVQNALLKSTS